MFAPILRAVNQLDDPAFLRVVWQSVLLSAGAFVAVVGGLAWGLSALFPRGTWLSNWIPDWIGQWTLGVAGGVGAAVLAVWLFVPVVVVVATLFLDQIAAAVERRYYPALPPPAFGAPIAVQVWDGLALGLQVLLLQGVALILTLVLPGIGLVLGWLVSGWGVGRGLFVAAGMRRVPRPAALQLYGRRRLVVVLYGTGLALMAGIPVLNLFAPVLGIAAMIHLLAPLLPSTGVLTKSNGLFLPSGTW